MADLESDIRYRFDLEGFSARHPTDHIYRMINDAYRDLRDRLSSDGSQLFVSVVESGQLPGRTPGYPGTVIDDGFLTVFTIVHEVHCLLGASWMPLRHVHLQDALTNSDNSQTGVPMSWALVGIDNETQLTTPVYGQTVNVLIIPPLDQTRSIRIIGVKGWNDLRAPTDKLMTDIGLQEYVLASVGVILAQRDDDAALYGARLQERERTYEDLKHRSKRRDPGQARRVDVRRRTHT